MSTVIHLDFTKGTIKTDIAELPEKMLKTAFEAIDEKASLIVYIAKTLVRWDTGTLHKSIRKERGGIGKRWRIVRVRAGGYFVNWKTGKIVDYAHWVEIKYPFLRAAGDIVTRNDAASNYIRQKIIGATLQ